MTIEKPKPKAVRVIFRDDSTNESRCVTIYNTTPDQAAEHFKKLMSEQADATKPSKSDRRSSAA